MRIRPTTRADMAAVDALLARSYPRLLKADYPPSVLVTALPLISRAQPGLLISGTYFVAEDNGAILGAGGWTPDARLRSKGHIRHLVVDDRYVRRGIARRLLEHSFETARTAGIIELECWSTFTAQAFYRALGFDTLGPMDVPLKPGISFPALRMWRAL